MFENTWKFCKRVLGLSLYVASISKCVREEIEWISVPTYQPLRMAASQAVTVPIEPLGHPTGLRIIGVRTLMSATAPLHLWEDDSSRQPSGESHADLSSSSCCNSTPQRSVSPPPDTTCDIVAAADEKKLINGHQMHAALDKKKPTEHHHSLIDEAPHHNDLDLLEIMRNHAPPAIVASAAAPDHMSAAMAHRSLHLMMPMTPTEIEKAGLPPGKSTFFQATLNCVSMLYGLGILSSPFAVAKAGWMGAIISLLVSTAYAYSAYLMAKCVKHNPKCATYQDVASMAFGKRIRKLIAALFYIEITGTLVGYCISVGDNLAYIFPNSSLSLPGLSGRNFMIFVASLIMLPSVWLRDLSALSFTSMWCIASTILLLIAVMLAATVNHIGFTHPIPFLRIQGVPVAAGLYAFSYGGTSVFPSIYMSMKDPTKFTKALVVSFVIATSSIAGLGIVGAYMFGDHTASQITLSMPIHFITTKIILWMTVITPMFKFALQLSPITTALETHLYRRCKTSKNAMLYGMSTLMRSMVLASIAIFSMVFPYFEYIVALVGSSMTIAICMIFPCVFYMKLFWGQLKMKTIILISLLVIVGVIVGACGTIVSVQGLINKRRS